MCMNLRTYIIKMLKNRRVHGKVTNGLNQNIYDLNQNIYDLNFEKDKKSLISLKLSLSF